MSIVRFIWEYNAISPDSCCLQIIYKPHVFIGFNVPVSTFAISGHIRMLLACNRRHDNHCIVLPHYNITPQAHLYDFLTLNYSLYIEHLTMELQLPIWNLWLDSADNRTRDLPDMEWMFYSDSYGVSDEFLRLKYIIVNDIHMNKTINLKLVYI